MLRRDVFKAMILPLLWPFRARPRVGVGAGEGEAVTTVQKVQTPGGRDSGIILRFDGDTAFVWLDVTLARTSEPVLRGSCTYAPGAYAKIIAAINEVHRLTVLWPPHGSSLTFAGRLTAFTPRALYYGQPHKADFTLEPCAHDLLP